MSNWPVMATASTPNGTGVGYVTAVTGASAHTKGSWVEVISALPYNTAALLLSRHYAESGLQSLDIGIGASGSEIVAVADIIAVTTNAYVGGSQNTVIPVALPKGTRIALRSQGISTSQSNNWNVHPIAPSPLFPVGGRITTHGFTAASTTGTTVVAGAWQAYGTAVQFVSSAPNNVRGFAVQIWNAAGGYSDSTAVQLCDAGGNALSAPVALHIFGDTDMVSNMSLPIFVPCAIAKGTAIYIKVASDNGNTGTRDFVLYLLT